MYRFPRVDLCTPKGDAIKILSGTKSVKFTPGPPTGTGFILVLDATLAVALEVVAIRIF